MQDSELQVFSLEEYVARKVQQSLDTYPGIVFEPRISFPLIKAFNRPSFASFALFRRTIVLKDWKLLTTMSTKFTCGWVYVLPFFASFHCSNATQPFLRLACHEEMFLLVVKSPVRSAKWTIKMSHASACWHFCIPSVMPMFIRIIGVLLTHDILMIRC